MENLPKLLIAWTTMANRTDAEQIAREVVSRSLAVCVQIDGPIVSCYRWHGKVETAQEFRLMFKVLEPQQDALAEFVTAKHPYEIPEWVVAAASNVGEKYLSWAGANSSNPPL